MTWLDSEFFLCLEHVSDPIILLEHDFRLIFFNDHANRLYPWLDKQTLGFNFLTLCEANKRTAPIASDFFDQGVRQNLTQRFQLETGPHLDVNWSIFPLGHPCHRAYLIGHAQSIEQGHFEEYISQVIDHTPGSLYWKDRQGRYLGCNATMRKIAGFDSNFDIVGKTDAELWPEASVLMENDQQVMTLGETRHIEESVTLPDGKQLHFAGIKMPLKNKWGETVGIIGNSLNVTVLKQMTQSLEEANQKLKAISLAKSEFIRNMEHDIRTPFSGILGLADHLWQQETDTDKKSVLSDILYCSKEILEYFNNLLDFHQSESGSRPLIEKNIHLDTFINAVVTMEKPAAQVKGLDFRCCIHPELPEVIISDPHRLKIILLNLISNAIKFTQKGHVDLNIQLNTLNTLNKASDLHPTLTIVVSDSGPGIPQGKQALIYEKFVRLTSSNRGKHQGMGLGLSMVKQVINELSGSIELESSKGKGALFRCFLPVKLPSLNP